MARPRGCYLDPREEGVLASHYEVVELPELAAAQRPRPAQVRARRGDRHGGHGHLGGLGVVLRRGPPAATGQVEGRLPQQLHLQQVSMSIFLLVTPVRLVAFDH